MAIEGASTSSKAARYAAAIGRATEYLDELRRRCSVVPELADWIE